MPAILKDILRANRRGERQAVYAVCTVNACAIRSALEQARRDQWPLLVEATAQQVNADGGYSGMTPSDFAAMVHRQAADVGLDPRQIILGGDHIGPHPWAGQPASNAMTKARELVQALIAGGFAKLHIDTATPCRDDPRQADGSLSAALIVARSIDLLAVAEETARREGLAPPVYVVGSDVPPPGGSAGTPDRGGVSLPEDLEAVVAAFRKALEARGLGAVWPRVIAIVARTGGEFSSRRIQPYAPAAARRLVRFIDATPGLAIEAHSTDYQTPRALAAMVADHMAILKVGPWLTYTFREAVFQLAHIEAESLRMHKGVRLSRLAETMEAAMVADPRHWRQHYHGHAEELAWLRRNAYSDRIRYYWRYPGPAAALQRLVANLRRYPPSGELIAAHMPAAARAVAEGHLAPEPEALVRHAIGGVIDHYAAACGASG